MDPLSVIASIISIGGAAVSSAQGLYNLVQSVRDAPQELATISNNVRVFYMLVSNLQTALDEDNVRDVVQEDQAMLNMWYFAKKEVNDLIGRLEASRLNVDTSLHSITLLCVVRLRAAGLKAKAPSISSETDRKDNDAGSALRAYVKEASIAGSLAPSLRNLSLSNVGEETLVAQSRDRTPSPHSLTISNATERMRRADNQRTALHQAAKSGDDLNIIELVIEDGADVNAKDADGMTALHFAAMHGKENAALVLLQNGANVHAQTVPPREISRKWERKFKGGRTPLHWAAVEGYEAVVRILLDHHADPGAKSTTYRTPLQEALMQGHEIVAQTLIERGAPINDADDEDWTPLHECCHGSCGGSKAMPGRLRLARLLLNRGAHVNAVTADETLTGTAMHFRATPLLLSALGNKPDFVPLLVTHGADPRACNKGGEMAIHLAALIGHVNFISVMLDAGVEVDIRDQYWSETALHKAASQDRLPATELLLERGADPSAVNRRGRNVLQHTVAVQPSGNPEIVILLQKRLEAIKQMREGKNKQPEE